MEKPRKFRELCTSNIWYNLNDMSRKSVQVMEWLRRQKVKATIYLGSKCCLCGYSKCSWALHAHHVDPEKKSFSISVGGVARSWQKVMNELDKCVLLCANCHAEVHAGLVGMTTLSEILMGDLPLRKRRAETIIGDSRLTVQPGRNKLGDEPRPKNWKEKYCLDCGVLITRYAKRCVRCLGVSRRKISWPPRPELLAMLKESSYLAVGRKLGVSDNAIRKHLRSYAQRHN